MPAQESVSLVIFLLFATFLPCSSLSSSPDFLFSVALEVAQAKMDFPALGQPPPLDCLPDCGLTEGPSHDSAVHLCR